MTPAEKEKGHTSDRISYLKEKNNVESRTKISSSKKENKLRLNPSIMQKMSLGTFLIFVILVSLLISIIAYGSLGLYKTHRNNILYVMHIKTPLQINRIFIRNMKAFTNTCIKLMYEGKPVASAGIRAQNMVTWRTTTREEMPKKAPYPPMERDLVTNLRIMHPIDYSGKNHILLNDHDETTEKYYKVYGSFTTSPTPFEGRPPIFVSSITLEGKNKYQYLHVYPEPLLLPRTCAQDMHYTTMFLPSKDEINALIAKAKGMQEYLEYIKDETNNY